MILKQQPEDFIVKELIVFNNDETGQFSYFLVQKKNRTTLEVAQELARQLNIPLKRIGFAGFKDKCAITTQMFSIKNKKADSMKTVHIKNTRITLTGQGAAPISLGSHIGNQFIITVRAIDSKPIIPFQFINLFGEQRFSSNNAEIGKALVKKDFNLAAKLASKQHMTVKHLLVEQPTDPLRALRSLPLKLLKFYISAFQSHLWNIAVHICLEKHTEKTLPLPGFGMRQEPCILETLKQESITNRDFVIQQLPELSAEGGERPVLVTPEKLMISPLEPDELNEGKQKCVLEFFLSKGAYATEIVRQLFLSSLKHH